MDHVRGFAEACGRTGWVLGPLSRASRQTRSFHRDDDPAARVLYERGGGGSQVADGRDKRCEPPIAEASGQLSRLFVVGLDDEEDCPAAAGLDGRRIGDSDQNAAGRTSVVERSRISPPMTSNTTSTSPASSSWSLSRSRNSWAPWAPARSRSEARPVPMMWVPASRASCTATERRSRRRRG